MKKIVLLCALCMASDGFCDKKFGMDRDQIRQILIDGHVAEQERKAEQDELLKEKNEKIKEKDKENQELIRIHKIAQELKEEFDIIINKPDSDEKSRAITAFLGKTEEYEKRCKQLDAKKNEE